MKVVTKLVENISIAEFADKHNLTMDVNERELPIGNPSRFYAKFHHSEVEGDGVLIGMFGNGPTPEDAIIAYAKEITFKTIVMDAYGPNRREICVPRLKESM